MFCYTLRPFPGFMILWGPACWTLKEFTGVLVMSWSWELEHQHLPCLQTCMFSTDSIRLSFVWIISQSSFPFSLPHITIVARGTESYPWKRGDICHLSVFLIFPYKVLESYDLHPQEMKLQAGLREKHPMCIYQVYI